MFWSTNNQFFFFVGSFYEHSWFTGQQEKGEAIKLLPTTSTRFRHLHVTQVSIARAHFHA